MILRGAQLFAPFGLGELIFEMRAAGGKGLAPARNAQHTDADHRRQRAPEKFPFFKHADTLGSIPAFKMAEPIQIAMGSSITFWLSRVESDADGAARA
jgi:hypothetical protein